MLILSIIWEVQLYAQLNTTIQKCLQPRAEQRVFECVFSPCVRRSSHKAGDI